jgi:AcrR family transcriptional regulator
VRRIAADAGMSTMNVYSRFGGKNGVVEHLFLRGFALLAHNMDEVPVTADPLADLHECGRSYRRFALEHPTLYAVMFERVVPDYEPSPGALASGLATLEHLAHRLQRVMDAGLMRPAPSLHVAAMVWSTCHGAVSLELKQKLAVAVDWEAVFRDTTDTLIRGLRT